MPDVEITNPTVAVDLADNESFTVPAGERHQVTIMHDPGGQRVSLNGVVILRDGSGFESNIHTLLVGGDTIVSREDTAIRGYKVG